MVQPLKANRKEAYVIRKVDHTEHSLLTIEEQNPEVEAYVI